MAAVNNAENKKALNILFVQNDEGSVLPTGTPVYIKGNSNGTILVGKADSNSASKMPAVGITVSRVEINQDVDIVLGGFLEVPIAGLTAAQPGQNLYVAGGGGLTTVEPSGEVQSLGKILKTNAANTIALESLIAFGGASAGGGITSLPLQEVLDVGNIAEGVNAFVDLYTDASRTYRGALSPANLTLTAPGANFILTTSGISHSLASGSTAQTLSVSTLQQFVYTWINGTTAVQFRAEDTGFKYSLSDTGGAATLEFDNTDGLQINNPAITGYKFPLTDGTANQLLQTDGSGTLSFVDAPSPVGTDLALVTRDTAFSATGHHEGTTLSIGTAALTTGTVYMWGPTDWGTANAGAVATADGLMGVATTNTAGGDVLVNGIIQLASVPGSAGDVLYLDTTNGTLTATAPTGSGEIVRVMGYNLDGNRIYFNPSQDWLEI